MMCLLEYIFFNASQIFVAFSCILFNNTVFFYLNSILSLLTFKQIST